MTVFNKRNALVGFVTLKALEERRRRRKRLRGKAPKIALFSILGLASLGAIVALGAVHHRRRGGETDVVDAYSTHDATESEIVGEYVTSPEPIPAT